MTPLYLLLWLCGAAIVYPFWKPFARTKEWAETDSLIFGFLALPFIWPFVAINIVVTKFIEHREAGSVEKQLALKKAKLELKKVEKELEGM